MNDPIIELQLSGPTPDEVQESLKRIKFVIETVADVKLSTEGNQ